MTMERIAGSITEAVESIGRSMTGDAAHARRVEAYDREQACKARRGLLVSSGVAREITVEDIGRVVADTCEPNGALAIVQRWYAAVSKTREIVPGVVETYVPRRVEVTPRVVVLLGNRGIGKTVAAAWMHARVGGMHVPLAELNRSYRSHFGPDRKLFRRALANPFLTIDEPDIDVSPEEARPLLHALVHGRQSGPLTLITGNLSAAGFTALLDPRTLQRLGPIAFVRVVKGTSMRQARPDGGLAAAVKAADAALEGTAS